MLLRLVKFLLLTTLFATTFLASLIVICQDHLVLPTQRWPWQRVEEPPVVVPEGRTYLTLPTGDDSLVRIVRVERRVPGELVLVSFHGNGVTLARSAQSLEWFAKIGLTVYEMDYRGSGISSGQANEELLKKDALLFVDQVAQWEHQPTSDIVAYGRSFGTGLASYIASQRELAGVVLISPYTSLQEVAAQTSYYRPLLPLMRWNLPQREYSAQFRSATVLILHGKRDLTIPVSSAEKLSKMYPPETMVTFINDEEGDHHNIFARHQGEIAAYLASLR